MQVKREYEIGIFQPISRFILKTIQDTAIVTMAWVEMTCSVQA